MSYLDAGEENDMGLDETTALSNLKDDGLDLDECDRCGKPFIKPFTHGYSIYCSQECLENDEPSDGDAWSGGFADNH